MEVQETAQEQTLTVPGQQVPDEVEFGIFKDDPPEQQEAAPETPKEPVEDSADRWDRFAKLEGENRKLKSTAKEYEKAHQDLSNLRQLIREDPKKALELLDADILDVASRAFDLPVDEPEEAVEQPRSNSEVAELREQLQQLQQQLQQTHNEKIIAAEQKKYHDHLRDMEEYEVLEMIGLDRVLPSMLEAQEAHYRENHSLLPVDELSKRTAKFYTEELDRFVDNLTKLKRYQGKFGAPQRAQSDEDTEARLKSQTLTNALQQDNSSTGEQREMTLEEEEQAFLKLMAKEGWRDDEHY